MSDAMIKALLEGEDPNMWQTTGRAMGQQALARPYHNNRGGFWENFAINALPGLASGIMSGYGNYQQRQSGEELQQGLLEYLSAAPETQMELAQANPKIAKVHVAQQLEQQKMDQALQQRELQLRQQEEIKREYNPPIPFEQRMQEALALHAGKKQIDSRYRQPAAASVSDARLEGRDRRAYAQALQSAGYSRPEAARIASLPRSERQQVLGVERAAAVDRRFGQSQEFREQGRDLDSAERELPGAVPLPGAVRLGKAEAAKLRANDAQVKTLVNNLERMQDTNPLNIMGNDAYAEKVLGAQTIAAIFSASKSGGRMGVDERKRLAEIAPASFPQGRVGQTIVDRLTGRERSEQVQFLKEVIAEAHHRELALSYDRVIPGAFYAPETLREIGRRKSLTPQELGQILSGGQ
jgi:hypothetical protein